MNGLTVHHLRAITDKRVLCGYQKLKEASFIALL